jgi:hypothetical protein
MHTELVEWSFFAPKGKTPKFKSTGSGLKINVFSSMENDGAMRYMTYFKTLNCRLFIMIMRQLMRSSNGHKVFLIVFNIRNHHGKMVQKWVLKHKSEILIFYLPAYCPDPDPCEYLNYIIKITFKGK